MGKSKEASNKPPPCVSPPPPPPITCFNLETYEQTGKTNSTETNKGPFEPYMPTIWEGRIEQSPQMVPTEAVGSF